MNKFKFYFIVLIAIVSLFSCSKKDSETYVPPREYAVQYPTDLADIEDYLKTNYFTVVNHPGFVDDQDVTISKIDNGQASIMSYLNASTYPKLLVRMVPLHGIEYKLYYLMLRPGVGISPRNVDDVLASYRGAYLSRSAATATPPSELTATFFQEIKYPQSFMSLYNEVITGWSEIFPLFKTGTSIINADGTVTHNDFGAGVMFIPSGLGYYEAGKGSIPSYAPLVFSFKLYSIERLDQDNDGVFSYQEDLDNDGYVYDYRNTILYPTKPADAIRYADDTDKDGIPDFLDVDDDGDNYTTKLEITKPTDKVGVVVENGIKVNYGPSKYYPFDAFTIADDPSTPVDESLDSEPRGIPEYSAAGTPDYTTSGRKRIHLDKEHHTAKP